MHFIRFGLYNVFRKVLLLGLIRPIVNGSPFYLAYLWSPFIVCGGGQGAVWDEQYNKNQSPGPYWVSLQHNGRSQGRLKVDLWCLEGKEKWGDEREADLHFTFFFLSCSLTHTHTHTHTHTDTHTSTYKDFFFFIIHTLSYGQSMHAIALVKVL